MRCGQLVWKNLGQLLQNFGQLTQLLGTTLQGCTFSKISSRARATGFKKLVERGKS